MFLRGRTDFKTGAWGGAQTLGEGAGECKGEKFKYSHIFIPKYTKSICQIMTLGNAGL